MPTARFVFVRATAAQGLAPVGIGAATIVTLIEWSRLANGRDYEVESQDEAKVVAGSKWNAGDHAAAEDLSLYCEAYGIERLFISF
jgi:hypothetical protein